MPERRSPLRTERVAAASRLPAMLGTSLVIALVLIAVLKPWAAAAPPGVSVAASSSGGAAAGANGADQAAGGERRRGENAGATTAPDPTIDPLTMRKQCQDPDVWRLVTIERSGPLLGRSLLPVTLVAASGPEDPAIVPQIVRTGALVALGYCVPSAIHQDVTAAEESVHIWDAVGGRGPARLGGARIMDAALASVGEVYLAPPGSVPAPTTDRSAPTWPEGRYVFEIPADSPSGSPGWFAFSFASTAIAVGAP